jgi:MurNAc alpha-1-phosphate uridylyltransferase
MAQFPYAFNGERSRMKAMILAAGRGTRMGALTDDQPKPLLKLGGESLLERHLRRLAAAGFRDIVVNVSYNAAQIQQTIGTGKRWGVNVHYSVESDPPLETGGGIVKALPLLGPEPFLVVNGDVLTDFDFARLRLDAGYGVLVLVPNPPHHVEGDFGVDASSRIVHTPPKSTFAGISVLDCALFAGLAQGRRPLKPILDAAIAHGLLFGLRHEGLWIDVGTPERLALAREKLGELDPRPR